MLKPKNKGWRLLTLPAILLLDSARCGSRRLHG